MAWAIPDDDRVIVLARDRERRHPGRDRRAVLLHGAVWGAWHWPIIAMGYNYGTGYVGAPWIGFVAMAWATVAMGTFLAWVTARAGSVWPAALGHGTVNAFGSIGFLFLAGEPNLLFGPGPVGAVSALPWVALAAWLLFRDEPFVALRGS